MRGKPRGENEWVDPWPSQRLGTRRRYHQTRGAGMAGHRGPPGHRPTDFVSKESVRAIDALNAHVRPSCVAAGWLDLFRREAVVELPATGWWCADGRSDSLSVADLIAFLGIPWISWRGCE